MTDGEGGGRGGEGGGTSECLPMEDLMEVMLRNNQAPADTLAADRPRLEAADRIQRESWEAALKEKDAEIDRLRAEAADAKKTLQADASREMRWEAAYELLLGANQKLAELRDGDMEDFGTCAETLNSKEVESCTKFSQNTTDHIPSDFRKLKQAYETLSSKKDMEVSALLSEKDSLRSQLGIMQRDCAELLKNLRVEAALKLQQSVDEHKLLNQKKDDEIGRLRAEAGEAKKKNDKDFSALLSEKDHVRNQLDIMQLDFAELQNIHQRVYELALGVDALQQYKSAYNMLVQKTDDEIGRLRAEAVETKKKHHKDLSALLLEKDLVCSELTIMHQYYAEVLKNKKVEATQAIEAAQKISQSVDELQQSVDEHKALAQKKDDEIRILRAEAAGAKKKHDKDLSALLSEKDSVCNQLDIMQQDYTELLKNKKVEAAQATEVEQKLPRSVDELKVLTQKKDHEISTLGAEALGAKKKVHKMHSLVKEKYGEIHRLKCRHPESVQNHNKDISETHKKFRSGDPDVTLRDKPENSGISQTIEEDYISETKTVEIVRQDGTTQKRRRASYISNDDEMRGRDGDDDEQIGSDKDGDNQSGSDEEGDEQSGSDEEGDEQSGSDECVYEQSKSGDDDDEQSRSDGHRQSDSDEETKNNPIQKPPGNRKRKIEACNAETTDEKNDTESKWGDTQLFLQNLSLW